MGLLGGLLSLVLRKRDKWDRLFLRNQPRKFYIPGPYANLSKVQSIFFCLVIFP